MFVSTQSTGFNKAIPRAKFSSVNFGSFADNTNYDTLYPGYGNYGTFNTGTASPDRCIAIINLAQFGNNNPYLSDDFNSPGGDLSIGAYPYISGSQQLSRGDGYGSNFSTTVKRTNTDGGTKMQNFSIATIAYRIPYGTNLTISGRYALYKKTDDTNNVITLIQDGFDTYTDMEAMFFMTFNYLGPLRNRAYESSTLNDSSVKYNSTGGDIHVIASVARGSNPGNPDWSALFNNVQVTSYNYNWWNKNYNADLSDDSSPYSTKYEYSVAIMVLQTETYDINKNLFNPVWSGSPDLVTTTSTRYAGA